MRLLLVTGLSGAGKTTVLKTLEDMGHETIDNMPLTLVPMLLSMQQGPTDRMIVVGADVRSHGFNVPDFIKIVREAAAAGHHQVTTLYLECSNEELLRRYSETRRRHPLAEDTPVINGIQLERDNVEGLLDYADIIIDTTDLKPVELRQDIQRRFRPQKPHTLSIFIKSFAFKRGVPRDADLVFDVRFLRNPFYVEELKEKTGMDPAVGNYVAADPDYEAFFGNLTALLLPLLPRYQQEGKSYLTIAIGCTGGKHRSVYTAERLRALLEEAGYAPSCQHRDIEADKRGT
jgi:RNase adapter protein RapZ